MKKKCMPCICQWVYVTTGHCYSNDRINNTVIPVASCLYSNELWYYKSCCLCFLHAVFVMHVCNTDCSCHKWFFQNLHDNFISCLNVKYLFLFFAHSVCDLWWEQSSVRWVVILYTFRWFWNSLQALLYHPQIGSLEFVSKIYVLVVCILHGDYLVGKMGLGRAEQTVHWTVHMISCLYCTGQLTGASTASVSTNHNRNPC